MEDLKLDAESIARNKSYGAYEHLKHLLKVGWLPTTPLVKKFVLDNGLNQNDIKKAVSEIEEADSCNRCAEADK